MVRQLFGDTIRAWAKKFGLDIDKIYEDKYLEARRRQLTKNSVYMRYRTGRNDRSEDPREILTHYNDLKTRPSQATIDGATKFFVTLTKPYRAENLKVKCIANWINNHADYQTDSIRWGKSEYWSSPFDLWAEYLETDTFTDDCDGWAALMWWACTLIGIPKDRLFIWAGNASLRGKPYGHANLLYDNSKNGKLYHIEGSFLNTSNQKNWLGYPKGCSRYPETWFMFNDSRIAR